MDIQQLQPAKRINGEMRTPLLKQGDIIQGKVLKLYPNQRAQIQLGLQKMTARLETALAAGEQYHFHVQSTDKETRLQVLGDRLNEQVESDATRLLRQLGIKPTKQHKALIEQLTSEKIPFTKTQLSDAFFLSSRAGNKTQAQQTIVRLLTQNLPLTEAVFDAVYTKHTSDFSEQLEALLSQLSKIPESAELQQKLIERISLLIGHSSLLSKNPSSVFSDHLHQVLQFTGLDYENQPKKNQQAETIKSMILQLANNSEGKLGNRAQQILHFINGLQLNSVDETPNMIQACLQLPCDKLELNRDLYLEFSGKKTKTGKLGTDHCRILFYLDLKHLHETVIDMNVQKRAVSLTVYNDYSNLERNLLGLKPTFKDMLHKLDYHLSNVIVQPLKQVQLNSHT